MRDGFLFPLCAKKVITIIIAGTVYFF